MNSLQKLVCFLTETTEMEKKAWQTGYIVLVIFALIPWIVLTIYFITLKYHVKYYVNNELVNVAKYKKKQLKNILTTTITYGIKMKNVVNNLQM